MLDFVIVKIQNLLSVFYTLINNLKNYIIEELSSY